MTTKPAPNRSQDLLSVRARTSVGSRDWFLRVGRGFRTSMRDIADANHRVGEMRVDRNHVNPF